MSSLTTVQKLELTHRLQLLSSIGVNASQINQSINNLPSVENGAKRRRGRGRAGRTDALPDIGPSYAAGEGDVASWGRNWHETIILSGIEYQRQRVRGLAVYGWTSVADGRPSRRSTINSNAGCWTIGRRTRPGSCRMSWALRTRRSGPRRLAWASLHWEGASSEAASARWVFAAPVPISHEMSKGFAHSSTPRARPAGRRGKATWPCIPSRRGTTRSSR